MQRPLKIVSRDFSLGKASAQEIREKASALEHFCSHLGGCEVAVCVPAIRHHRKGGPFTVQIRLTVPGKELAVDRQAERGTLSGNSRVIRCCRAAAAGLCPRTARQGKGARCGCAGPCGSARTQTWIRGKCQLLKSLDPRSETRAAPNLFGLSRSSAPCHQLEQH